MPRKLLPKKNLTLLRKIVHYLKLQKKNLSREILDFSISRFPFIYNHIILTNNAASKKDGTGAQVQRILATAALSERLRVRFQQSKIIDVAVHPLDPFQDSKSYGEFIKKLNFVFRLDFETHQSKIEKVIDIKNLTLLNLLKVSLLSYLKKQNTLLQIENPYSVSDLNVNDYILIINKLSNLRKLIDDDRDKEYVSIHYRQGVGNFAIYPGQSISREISIEHFKTCIAKHMPFQKISNLIVHVFTDSPKDSLKYVPPSDQAYLWEGTPGFVNGVMEIHPLVVTSEDLGVAEVVIHSGGDPVDAILAMANSTLLVSGRSSLSYVAGLLNTRGIVVAAPDFWHPPLSHWKN